MPGYGYRRDELALSPDPAVVHRILEHVVDPSVVETELACDLLNGNGSGRVLLKDAYSYTDLVCVDREDVGRRQPHEAEGGVAARISEVAELRRIAVGDPLAKSTAVPLRLVSLGDHLVPVPRIGAEQATIAHDPGDTGRVKGVLDQLEGPPKVALPAHAPALTADERAKLEHHLGEAERLLRANAERSGR